MGSPPDNAVELASATRSNLSFYFVKISFLNPEIDKKNDLLRKDLKRSFLYTIQDWLESENAVILASAARSNLSFLLCKNQLLEPRIEIKKLPWKDQRSFFIHHSGFEPETY